MSIRTRLRTVKLAFDILDIVDLQKEAIETQERTIELLQRERIDLMLGYSRIGRDLIVQFLVALDQPENQDVIRHKLHAALVDFNDEVARLEEQTR